jgi:hypothetical protein
MSAVEDELIEKIRRLDVEKQQRVLQYVETIEDFEQPASTERKYYSARELIKMPLEERNRLVSEALARSQDQDIEVLEAFDDLDFDDKQNAP